MELIPYLSFEGRCEEAMTFYARALGGTLELMRFKDAPEAPPGITVTAANAEKIMHSSLVAGDMTLMASDGECSGTPRFEGISLSLTTADVAQARRVYAALLEGGTVEMPLGETHFSPAFGIVCDRYGLSWMIHVEAGD